VRLLDYIPDSRGEQQRLLLILTDENPNDDTRLPGTGDQFFSRDYSGKPAVADAAEEATALRRHGNPPLCLFSGREGDLSSARTIYGRIVAEADRVIDPETITRRTVQYGLAHCPELDREEQYARCLAHLQQKYAEGGYLRLWIAESENARRLEELRGVIRDPQRLRKMFDAAFDTETAE